MVVMGSFVLSAVLALVTPATPRDGPPVARDPREATVVVQSADGFSTQTGAGVIVAIDEHVVQILTVAHIFRDRSGKVETTSGFVGFFSGRGSVTDVSAIEDVKFSGTSDLAIVNVPAPSGLRLGAVRLATLLPHVGDPLTVVGHPYGTELFSSAPAKVVLLHVATYAFAFSCTACVPGDSGGGVFNAEGELVGIEIGETKIADRRGNIIVAQANLSQPVASIEQFLADLWTF